jgi:hypothetical protein
VEGQQRLDPGEAGLALAALILSTIVVGYGNYPGTLAG